SYPLRITALIGVLDLLAFAVVAIAVGDDLSFSAFSAFALLCVAILATWEAHNQAGRRIELAEAAEALRAIDEATRLQTRQQREVASFGQTAVEGASIHELENDAVRLLKRVLETDMAGVLKLIPSDEEFLVVAAVGLPEEEVGKARVPAGFGSQSGYALGTGAPTVVTDWSEETRFKQPEVLASRGMTSGVSVPIKGKGNPYGVLGVQTKQRRAFVVEDVDFMQALANVLANAIERRAAEERTRHEALHDPLTGLPNRSLFLDRLEHALDQMPRHDSAVAVLFLDLDQFKLVNDSLGHAAGDELLAAVSPRLQQALRPGDTVARFGGDEFAVLAEDITNERDAIRVAERIAESLTRPFVLRGREHFASASIGISIGEGNEEPEALIRDADAALYRAKERGRGGYEIFDEVMRSRVVDHMQTENDLRRALQRRELELHFQPIISLADDSVVMLEALLRWRHPERGLLGSVAFIPVAEESRLIVPIGRWVIEEACRRAAAWQALDPDGAPIGVAVNISVRQLADPNLLRCIGSALEQTGIDPATLRLELTESSLFEEGESTVSLDALRALGVGLVLDDFGTGFSSLGYLKRLPLSGVKLDRAFIENLSEGGDDAAIVRAINEMATALGLDVYAEGVETAVQLEAVRELGCSHAQGFHLGAPLPAEEAHEQLRQATHTG
ncbi:MAG: EAL domain-containing protein, partial [Actinomycetota bacterium]|nr:EAL domain-containing protein [Actinomycetota bacterium]